MKIEFNGTAARYYLRNIHRYGQGFYGKELTLPSNNRIKWSFPTHRGRDRDYCTVEAHPVHLRALHRVIIDDLRKFSYVVDCPARCDVIPELSWEGARKANGAIFDSLPQLWEVSRD